MVAQWPPSDSTPSSLVVDSVGDVFELIDSSTPRAARAAPEPERHPVHGGESAAAAALGDECVQGQFSAAAGGAAEGCFRRHSSHQDGAAASGGDARRTAGAAVANDIAARERPACAEDATGGPPKRRRLRGKQSVPAADTAVVTENMCTRTLRPLQGHQVRRDGPAGGDDCVTNSLHDGCGGPSRLCTPTWQRYVLYNRDGHTLNSGTDASGAQRAELAGRNGSRLALGHVAAAGRPPDAPELRRPGLPLG
jgi:hypothetical protein